MHSIWNGECLVGIELGSQHKIVLAGVTDTYGSVKIPETPFDQFIEMDASEIIIAEEGMLSKHGL